MFNKRTTVILLALAVLMLLSIGVTFAQDTTPRGGTVVVNESNSSGWVRNFNPFSPNPIGPTTRLIYDPMVVYNPTDGGKPTWWLATGSQYSDDLLSVTFTLRDGVKWSDGEPFTADDVVFTFNLLQKFPALDRGGVNAFVKSVTKVDNLTVKFDLSDVYTLADIYIGGVRIVPEHAWKDVADPVTYTNDNPIATGPFTEVQDFSEQSFKICRNPNFWQEGKPYVDCLQYPAINGNDAANLSLINGDLDWVGNFVPDIQNTYVAKDPDHNHYYFWGNSPWVFMVNMTKKPFDDVKVRQAMALSIDYNAVRDNAEYGYINVTPENAVGIWPRWQDQVPQTVLDTVKEMGLGAQDVDRANKILDDAGYAKGSDGFRNMPDGTPIGPFTIQFVNGWTDVVTASQIVAQGFQDIGLDASVVTPEFGAWINNLQQGTYDTSLAWSTWGVTAWDYYHNSMDSTLITADGQRTGQFNPGWVNTDSDQLLKDFIKTIDPAQRAEIIGKLADQYVTNVITTPLAPFPAWYEYSTKRFVGWPTEDNYYAQGSPWQNEAARLVAIQIHCVDDTSCGQSK